jgi:UDP-N-acetylmuramate--alanine ligase
MGSNARLGKSQYLVAEADESDRSFLKLSPILAVVTNIDREHMDCYRNMRDVKNTFLEFMNHLPFYGMVVACNDNAELRQLLPAVQRRTVTYGTRPDSDFHISGLHCGVKSDTVALSTFQVSYRGTSLGEFCLRVPGEHNIRNATAAIAVGVGLDLPADDIRRGLEDFNGVDRRFQLIGAGNGISVVDDYGHHPTEIRATLAAARQCDFRRVHVVFQPHRFTRTQLLLEEFGTAFRDADTVIVVDIYPAGEPAIPGVNAQVLAGRITESSGCEAIYVPSLPEAAVRALQIAAPGDLILTLGAGSISQLGPQLVELLRNPALKSAGD